MDQMTVRRPGGGSRPPHQLGTLCWVLSSAQLCLLLGTSLTSPLTRQACFLPGVTVCAETTTGAEHSLGGSVFLGPATGSGGDGLHTRGFQNQLKTHNARMRLPCLTQDLTRPVSGNWFPSELQSVFQHVAMNLGCRYGSRGSWG